MHDIRESVAINKYPNGYRQTTRIYEPSPLEGYFSGQVQTMAWETDTNPFIPEEWLGMSFCSYFGFNIYLHFDKFPA